jgi:hypothetical protein
MNFTVMVAVLRRFMPASAYVEQGAGQRAGVGRGRTNRL